MPELVCPGQRIAVDCHAHVLRKDYPLAEGARFAPTRDATVEEYLRLLDGHGLTHGVITAPSFYGTDNRLLLDALSRAGGRLRGTVTLAEDSDRRLLPELDRHGVVGIRINTFASGAIPDLESQAYRSLFSTAAELGWHVEFNLATDHVTTVLARMASCPADIVLDHFGAPDPARGVDAAGFRAVRAALETGRVWVKLSTPLRPGFRSAEEAQPFVDALVRSGGPGQILWSTDWPWVGHEGQITYQECLDCLSGWIGEDEARQTIVSVNPQRLFKLNANDNAKGS